MGTLASSRWLLLGVVAASSLGVGYALFRQAWHGTISLFHLLTQCSPGAVASGTGCGGRLRKNNGAKASC